MKWTLLKCQIIAHVEIEGEYRYIYANIPQEDLNKYIEAGLADVIGEEIICKEEGIKEKEDARPKIKLNDFTQMRDIVIGMDFSKTQENYLKTIYNIDDNNDPFFGPIKSKKWR